MVITCRGINFGNFCNYNNPRCGQQLLGSIVTGSPSDSVSELAAEWLTAYFPAILTICGYVFMPLESRKLLSLLSSQ
jgi:hypothetical protein